MMKLIIYRDSQVYVIEGRVAYISNEVVSLCGTCNVAVTNGIILHDSNSYCDCVC